MVLDSLRRGGYDAINMSATDFFQDLFTLTFSQIISVFSGIFIFGLLIHFISHLTFNSLGKAFGTSGTYFIAWLGTPIHELGHVLFCIIFGHKITKMEFFKPDPQTGTLGYVNHQWNKANPWQVLGNFFIGIGPVILGCLVLFGLFYLLVPNSSGAWDSIVAAVNGMGSDSSLGDYFIILKDSLLTFIKYLFTAANISTWQFWVFCYLSICVAANIRLSWSDIKNSLSGFIYVIVLLLLINIIGLLTGLSRNGFFPFTTSSLSIMYGLLILALIMTLIGFLIIYGVAAIYTRFRYRQFLNPF